MKPVSCLAIVYESGGIFIDSSIKYEVQLSGLIKLGEKASIKRVTVSESKKRSLDSNALQAVWIREVSEHTGESIAYVRATVKRDLGLPILRFEAVTPEEIHIAKMMNATLKAINYDLMNPKQQLNVIKMFSVTSAMSTKQHKKMLDDMCNSYADKLGLVLVSNKA
jgi:hypothetical protein